MNLPCKNRHAASRSKRRITVIGIAVGAVLASCAPHAFAQSAPVQIDGAKLVEILVGNGVITREQADQLVREATINAPAVAAAPAADPDVQTIPHIPEPVRRQMQEELRAQVMQQAQQEGWAAPNALPEWPQRITLSGDVRVRGEGAFLDETNYRDFVDFGAVNDGAGYDVSPSNLVNPPYLNSTEDRDYLRVRARFGASVQVDDWITAELRIATGSDNNPVSTNQTLGADGTGKYELWLDRANVQLRPLPGLRIDAGRAENPFWTSELLFDTDMNFDGLSARYRQPLGARYALFGTLGAFPIFNTDFDFGSRNAGMFESKDRYLLGAQLGASFEDGERIKAKLAAGYFDFDGVQGEISSPCEWNQDVCDTDATRPSFAQFGNTYFPIRDVIPDPLDPVGSAELQYFGLASKYEILNVHAAFDLRVFEEFTVRLEGDYVKNLGFDRNLVAGRGVNNLGPATVIPNPDADDDPQTDDDTIVDPGRWEGGDTGWYANLMFGHPAPRRGGEWNFGVGYRYIETDAVLDAFADSDFHLGGTNAEGYILRTALGIGKRTALNLSWFSANEIDGAPYANDVLQLDLNTSF